MQQPSWMEHKRAPGYLFSGQWQTGRKGRQEGQMLAHKSQGSPSPTFLPPGIVCVLARRSCEVGPRDPDEPPRELGSVWNNHSSPCCSPSTRTASVHSCLLQPAPKHWGGRDTEGSISVTPLINNLKTWECKISLRKAEGSPWLHHLTFLWLP